jgi:hypothetical protein
LPGFSPKQSLRDPLAGAKAVKGGACRETANPKFIVNDAAMIPVEVSAASVCGLVEAKALVGIESRRNATKSAASSAIRPQPVFISHPNPL